MSSILSTKQEIKTNFEIMFERDWPNICNFAIAQGQSMKICTETPTPAIEKINDFFR